MLFLYFIISGLLAAGCFFFHNKLIRKILSVIFVMIQICLSIYAYQHLHQEELGYFTFDATAVIFLFVLTLLSITTLYHSFVYLEHRNETGRKMGIYLAALIGLIVSMSGVYMASHTGLMWAMTEATTLCVSVLIYHERTSLSIEATWKYVFICSIGMALALVGILFLSIGIQEAGSTDLSFSSIPKYIPHINSLWLKLAFLFLTVGFSTKMGLFPMHPICVDAHTVAPPPVSAFISTALMNVGFIGIFRVFSLLSHSSILIWMQEILLWAGLLSILVSAVYLLSVTHLKRMSAYSSLEHMGLSAVGLAMGGIGYFGAILHLVIHSFLKSGLFYQLDQVHRVYKSYSIDITRNYFKLNTTGAIVILLLMLGITGIPPSGLFVSEFYIFTAMFHSGRFIPMILILIFLSFAIYGLGKNIIKLIFNPPEQQIPEEIAPVTIHSRESISQYILFALAIYLAYFLPQPFMTLLKDAIHNLPN